MRQIPQLQTHHEKRSGRLIVRSITNATAIPPAAAATVFCGWPAVRRAITSIAREPRVMIVRRMAMSSYDGVMSRQPGIRITLHAGAVRPQP